MRNTATVTSDQGSLQATATTPITPVSGDGIGGWKPIGLTTVLRSNMTGRLLGGYQLQGLLGSGGMGEVYRAHDASLGAYRTWSMSVSQPGGEAVEARVGQERHRRLQHGEVDEGPLPRRRAMAEHRAARWQRPRQRLPRRARA